MMYKKYNFFVAGLVLLCACNPETKQIESEPIKEEKLVLVETPEFNKDSAFKFVEKQVLFGKRVPNTAPHEKCAKYFVNTLKKYNWQVTEQKFESEAFDKTKLKLNNIIASYKPEASKRILLTAHWDTRPFADQDPDINLHKTPIDGANDGGSGVGVLLEIARVINESKIKPNIGIDIILFDGEDYGAPSFAQQVENSSKTWCLGSQYWSQNKHLPAYTAYYGVLLDMVGAPNAKYYKDGTSKMYAPMIQRQIWDVAKAMSLDTVFVDADSDEIIDDHLFINQNAHIPTVDIIEYEPSDGAYFSKTWHTKNDDLAHIDKNSLGTVGKLLLQLLYREK